ncbi:MAG: dTDP-4-dehydrorhamnose 3,5-epimerase family protein [Nitrospirae bacterium]|nr:dTDP-4-dehydrorhamnose 3,5-epimerase family protein [Nitrospirota bacterium]
MKIIEVKSLTIDSIKVIRFQRFRDNRGYFTETFRNSDFLSHPELGFIKQDKLFSQSNESYSKTGTIRGLHFQWNPYMGKLVRTILGRMVDMVLDIRKGSPYFGKIILYDMSHKQDADYDEWIWVPPGFAHGNFFTEDTKIEYLCTGEYSSNCEACISPLAGDIDWSLCNPDLKELFHSSIPAATISDKDRNGFSLSAWNTDNKSDIFVYK